MNEEKPPTENPKLLTNLLIKHLKQEQAIQHQLDKSLNIFADKIAKSYKSAKPSLDIRRFARKTASTKIAKSYKHKLAFDFLQKEISDILCSIPGKKDKYRTDLNELLRDYDQPNKLQNLYFYFCKFGNKNLGFDSGSTEREFIKEINNCLFLNVSFKSTKFIGIKFKLVKFINATHGTVIYNNLMRRSNTLRTLKTGFDRNQGFDFEHASLINCLFEECEFHNISLNSITFGVNNISYPYIGAYIGKCKFINGDQRFNILSGRMPRNAGNINPEMLRKHMTTLKSPLVLTDNNNKILPNGQIKVQNRQYIIQPQMIYEDCKFINYRFIVDGPANAAHFDKYLLNNCEFTSTTRFHLFFNIRFKQTVFRECTFNKIVFRECKFEDCCFKNCTLNNVKFDTCHIGNTASTEFDNCNLNNCTFNTCVFCNYYNPINTTIIRANCKLFECIFNRSLLINFKFNFDSIYKDDSSRILSMKKSEFICCNLYGTNFDYCDLEGSSFAARTICVENVNWFGNIFLKQSIVPSFGTNVTRKINDRFAGFDDEFKGAHKIIKESRTTSRDILKMKYSEYRNISINLEDFQSEFEPHDYFTITGIDAGHYQFVPATSFYRANIKSCNFQSIEGFQGFDFTQISKVRGNSEKSDLNSTNFCGVNLTNASFVNCNLIGTIFQAADVKGVDFGNTTLNENTDFENTMNTGLSINNEHINFGDLQNRANETHARAQFIINNRNKLRVFYNDHINKTGIKEFEEEEFIDFTNRISEIRTNLESQPPIDVANNKVYLINNMAKNLTTFIASRLEYNDAEKTKLKSDLDQCINQEFVDILVSVHEPLRNGEPGQWFWLSMVFLSIILLFSGPKLYLHTFMLYYFNEVFNAHGAGSKSCVLGMVERWVTIHSQTCEHFIMTLDINPSQATTIQKYDPVNPSKKDEKITSGFVEQFNDSSIIPEEKELNHKYKCNKFINLLKPKSDLPENKDDDLGVAFDYNISPNMRTDWHDSIKPKIESSEITTIDGICNDFVRYFMTRIPLENGLTPERLQTFHDRGEKTIQLLKKKFDNLKEQLKENEVPNLKAAIMYECDYEVTLDKLTKYFEEGEGKRKRKKRTLRKAKGSSKKAKSLSLKRSNSRSKSLSKRAKSDSSINTKNFAKLVEKVLVKEFANLSKEKLEKIFNKTVTINENLSDELVKDNKINQKALSEPNRRPRTLSKKSISKSKSISISKSRSRSKSRSLSKRSDSKVKLKTVPDYKAISLMNMNITDKPYREFFKNNFKKIQENYKELITNKKYTKNITKITNKQSKTMETINSKLLSKYQTNKKTKSKRRTTRRTIRRTLRRRTTRA
tara:strand:+ start:14381 stop:18385 length:4005 start_codon:yes stop_codon:yes gene_type:complete